MKLLCVKNRLSEKMLYFTCLMSVIDLDISSKNWLSLTHISFPWFYHWRKILWSFRFYGLSVPHHVQLIDRASSFCRTYLIIKAMDTTIFIWSVTTKCENLSWLIVPVSHLNVIPLPKNCPTTRHVHGYNLALYFHTGQSW